MSGIDDAEQHKRRYNGPYTPHNPIPTIQSYREEQKERRAEEGIEEKSRTERAQEAYRHWKGEDSNEAGDADAVYPTQGGGNKEPEPAQDDVDDFTEDDDADEAMRDTSEAQDVSSDPKERRKEMKKRKDGGTGEREVTDPVTHLPIKIHDFSNRDLKNTPQNLAPPRTDSGLDDEEISKHNKEQRQAHDDLTQLFPSPQMEAISSQLASVHRKATAISLISSLLVVGTSFVLASRLGTSNDKRKALSASILMAGGAVTAGIVWFVRGWTDGKVRDIFDRHVWEAEREEGKRKAKEGGAESTLWLSQLLSSVWPLVNPDLFTSLADTLEDVMQASLPKLVRMVSVEDIGQGSESIRILGVKWLPSGAAARNVSEDGKIQKKSENSSNTNDRKVPGEGEQSNVSDSKNTDVSKQGQEEEEQQQDESNVNEGMEAEEGEFVNMEIAFAYRARADGKSLRNRSKNAHLFLGFYLPANIKFPVWVELEGMVGVMRLRLQLTPDPPFFSLCTLTFLGQPKVDLSCVPLSKKGLNIMDLPVISNFVRSAVDAAMAEYVAPKSLTLDLKDMLVGDDFKKDTAARGVLVVRVRHAFDFKEGDSGFLFKNGSADAYVSVGWAKFGKPVWSTRVILSDMKPSWDETAFILVTSEELNVRERLRLQLWDSDRMTADDDLGRIEVDLKDLMKGEKSNGRMWDRQDGFRALKAGEGMPGKLDWSVGYFSKTRVQEEQIARQTKDPDIKTVEDLKRKVHAESERKLREASKDESEEIEQQKAQDLKEREDEIIINSPPSKDYPSGVFSIVIHQITGLELEKINKNDQTKNETASDEEDEGDDLPSAYVNVIINHQKVYRTRTKPKNGKPFFNAGCERFIRDWQSADVMISVRDARVHEDDALLGIVLLPLRDVFKKRSQVNGIYPLSGGVGYGKCRISMVFRSVQLQAPREMLGWEYGTLDIKPEIKVNSQSGELKGLRLKARTSLGRGKFQAGDDGVWKAKRGKNVRLAVKKRYSSPLVFEFRSSSMLKDSTPAFAVLWLKDIPDEEEKTINIPIWKGDLKRAETCVLDEYGDKVGDIEVSLKFWRGLSGYHSSLADKDPNLGNVMEVLDCAQDNNDVTDNEIDDDYDTNDDTSSSSSSDSDDAGGDDEDGLERRRDLFRSKKMSSDLESDGKRGPVDAIRDYKGKRKQLHRKNRGLMQWKGPRTVEWAKNKVVRGGQKVEGLFSHHEREADVETEV